MEEDAPTHPEDGKRLIESVCRQDKDSGRAGAGSLECLPENAQNLAEDEQLPERTGREEQETWPPLLSLPASPLPESHKKRGVEVRQEEELVTMAETKMHSLPDPPDTENPQISSSFAIHPFPTLSDSISR